MFSDAFPIKKVNDFIWEVEGEFIMQKDGIDGSLIGANPSAEGGGDEGVQDDVRTVINVVHYQKLEQLDVGTVKDYKNYLRGYLKSVTDRVERRYPGKISEFKTVVNKYFKDKVIDDFKNVVFYRTIAGYPPNQYYIPCNFREDAMKHT
ncbi:hypothetical protein ACTXT7_004815 [Hymenolepis weldensis]